MAEQFLRDGMGDPATDTDDTSTTVMREPEEDEVNSQDPRDFQLPRIEV